MSSDEGIPGGESLRSVVDDHMSRSATTSVTGRTIEHPDDAATTGDGDDRPLLSGDTDSPPKTVHDPSGEDGDAEDDEIGDRARFARATASLAPPTQPLTSMQFMALSTYWFGWSFLWLPLLIVIIPLQIMQIAGEKEKGSSLGTTLLLGSFVSLFCAPIFGSMSDSCRNKYGRRRPFMITGTAIASLALFVMAIAPTLGWLAFGFLALSIANNMILSPYSALVPDAVPADQRGLASGWLGLMSMLGYLSGGLICYYMDATGVFGAYFALALVHGLSMMVTVYFTHEIPLVIVQSPSGFAARCASFAKPMRSHDFRVVFFTRFLMQMGILTVQEYLQFYLQDAIGTDNFILGGVRVADNASRAVAILFLPVLLGALFSSLVSGWVSDRYGGRRKIIVYMSGVLMACTCILFSVTRSYAFDMFLGLCFGVGFGAFSTMDWAMATDVLPHPEEFAKDMGIWSLALILPQVIAAPIAGYMLDYFQHYGHNLGYSVVFLLAVVYYALGTFFVKELEGVA